MKKYDLMHQINTRGTFMASKYALPHLKKSSRGKYLQVTFEFTFSSLSYLQTQHISSIFHRLC